MLEISIYITITTMVKLSRNERIYREFCLKSDTKSVIFKIFEMNEKYCSSVTII